MAQWYYILTFEIKNRFLIKDFFLCVCVWFHKSEEWRGNVVVISTAVEISADNIFMCVFVFPPLKPFCKIFCRGGSFEKKKNVDHLFCSVFPHIHLKPMVATYCSNEVKMGDFQTKSSFKPCNIITPLTI